jgi:excisionase family DNA binding protein
MTNFNENLTIENLPIAVNSLSKQLARIESLLLKKTEPENNPNELLTIDEACKFLGLAKQTVYGKIWRKEMPGVLKPAGTKKLFFKKSEIIKYLESGKQKTHDELKTETSTYLIRKGGKNEK